MLDEHWIRSLHVQAMRHAELHAGHEPHVLFQASTIGALLEGSFEGDVSLSELAEHGDLGLGTVNHLDGAVSHAVPVVAFQNAGQKTRGIKVASRDADRMPHGDDPWSFHNALLDRLCDVVHESIAEVVTATLS